MKAWHFTGPTLRDGRPVPPDGEWLRHDEPLVMCQSGLHASVRILDALGYAPGTTCCRVALDGTVARDTDKVVASARKILWRVDIRDVLRRFLRLCALDVIHLWDPPDVVIRYLRTGDDSVRGVAWAAASAAANGSRAAASIAASVAVANGSRARADASIVAWATAANAADVAFFDELGRPLSSRPVEEKQNRRLYRMTMEERKRRLRLQDKGDPQ